MGRPYGIGEACRDLNTGSVPLRYQVGYRPPPYASLRPPVRLPRANNDAAMNTQKGTLIRGQYRFATRWATAPLPTLRSGPPCGFLAQTTMQQ